MDGVCVCLDGVPSGLVFVIKPNFALNLSFSLKTVFSKTAQQAPFVF
jgi:hypothetical protein